MSERLLSALVYGGLSFGALLAACDGLGKEDDGLTREELGTFTADTGGAIDVVADIPEGAVSSLVYCGPYGYDTLATAELITSPDGATAYDMNDPSGTAMRVGILDDLLPMVVPVSPDLDISSGAWNYRVYFDAESVTATCYGVYNTSGVGGEVNLNFVFVGADEVAPGLNANEGETTLATVVETVRGIWSAAGLDIGTITYSDFDGDVDTYKVVDGDTELGNLLREVPAPGDRSITFFFVQEVTDADGATILGLAGGPPGAAAVGGTSKSGVVVTTASFAEDPDEVARIMAHEGGHFLGLFHTTEKDGSSSDPLGDTPACTMASDADGNGILSTDECSGTGADNIMFWTGANTDMSSDQGWVMTRSSAVQ
jgi:hypothetical protein